MAKNKIDYDVVLIGGSKGSVKVLLQIIPKLPKEFLMAIVIVVHRGVTEEDLLLKLLQNKSEIIVKEAESNEPIKPGIVYLAPSDYHLLIENDKTFTLDYSEKVRFSRPSIDVTMKFAAEAYKHRLIGILLSGANADGALGMKLIQDNIGYTIVQDIESADDNFMPEAAESLIKADEILNVDEILNFLLEVNSNLKNK